MQGISRIHVPFALKDIGQIKSDLGKFSDDPDRYITKLQGFLQMYEMAWKDIMLILNQTLTANEKSTILENTESFGDQLHLENETYPTGSGAVLCVDPGWDYNHQSGIWFLRHFGTSIVEGLTSGREKPLN